MGPATQVRDDEAPRTEGRIEATIAMVANHVEVIIIAIENISCNHNLAIRTDRSAIGKIIGSPDIRRHDSRPAKGQVQITGSGKQQTGAQEQDRQH